MGFGCIVFFNRDATRSPITPLPENDVKAAFGDDLREDPVLPRTAVNWVYGRGGISWPFEVAKLSSEKGETTYGFYEIQVDGKKSMRGVQCGWAVVGGKSTSHVLASYCSADPTSDVGLAFDHFIGLVDGLIGNYCPAMVSKAVISAIRKHWGIPARKLGGVYFVPESHKPAIVDMVTRLQALNVDIQMVDCEKTACGFKAIEHAVRKTMADKLKHAVKRLGDYSDTTRTSTIENHIDEVHELLEMARLYEDVLSTKLDDVKDSIRGVEDRLKVALSGVDEKDKAKPAPDPEPDVNGNDPFSQVA